MKKKPLRSWFQNICTIEVLDLNEAFVFNLMKTLKRDTSNKDMIGYASAFEQICRILDKQNATPIHANIKSIITMSERLSNYTKQSMEKYFNSPVVSRYSNMENGIIAVQMPNNTNDFKINWASYYVEIFSLKEDKLAKSQEIGRIVITELFNFSMPFIRYDTGDLEAINYNLSPPVFTVIEGRKADIILNTKGLIVSSFIIAEINGFDGIVYSQLIQKSKNNIL